MLEVFLDTALFAVLMYIVIFRPGEKSRCAKAWDEGLEAAIDGYANGTMSAKNPYA